MRAVERPISEEDLQGYVDERLERERREKVERYLDAQPELSRRVAAYRDHGIALRMAFASHASEPIPPELNLNRLLEARLTRRPSPWWRAAAGTGSRLRGNWNRPSRSAWIG